MRTLVGIAVLGALGSVGAQNGWTLRTPTPAPSPRGWNMLTFDFPRGVTVLFGGHPGLGDTWEWNGTTWTAKVAVAGPPARSATMTAFEQATGRTILFGGLDAAGTPHGGT